MDLGCPSAWESGCVLGGFCFRRKGRNVLPMAVSTQHAIRREVAACPGDRIDWWSGVCSFCDMGYGKKGRGVGGPRTHPLLLLSRHTRHTTRRARPPPSEAGKWEEKGGFAT